MSDSQTSEEERIAYLATGFAIGGLDEAEKQAETTDPSHLLRVHCVLPSHEEIAGML